MINIELEVRQAAAVRHALYLHTKEDSIEFPSARVAILREAINILDKEIEKVIDEQVNTQVSETSSEDS
tara:strand:- start:300 stop:506 length:207 start_codon:yes stop_codon:yes gene_type:complete